MSEPKDPAIKLFGRTIQQSDSNHNDVDKDAIGEKPIDNKQENDAATLVSEESSNPDATSVSDNTSKATKTEEEHSDSSNSSQEKTLKKPDKILPCPRCNSMDTKFCYYNNYNVKQPRHFCKNCQRYWTAGGTMRNVPVGAGRRKNKASTSHYRHITASEALQNNGTVLTFGSDPPLHESMASALKLTDRNGSHKPEALQIPKGSSNSKEEATKSGTEEPMMQNFPGYEPCFPGAPWPYAWNAIPPPGFFPMPFCPTPAYWSFAVPGGWNVPWVPRPNPEQAGPNSPTLGKHSREEGTAKQGNNGEEPVKEKNGERCLWIPKTLRIDDPSEAAKSSIWTTLGIKHDKTESIGGRGHFKAFEPKSEEKNHTTEASSVLQANPAALSRSVKFHERS